MVRLGVVCVAIAYLAATAAEADPAYTIFDVSGARSTAATGIDGSGTVGGYYTTLKGKCRAGCGFTRAPDGTISTFIVKGCTDGLQIRGMNASGDMVGFCLARIGGFSFVRSADGTISRVKNMKGSTATLNRISENGISGGYFYSAYGAQPFLRMPDGSKHLLEGAKKMVGSVEGISPSGISTGDIAAVPSDPAKAFIYTPDEKIQIFSVPSFSWAVGGAINDAGDVAGVCENTAASPQGFVRNADGSFETFDLGVEAQGSVWVSAIVTVGDDRQVIGQAAKDANEHWFGFIRHQSGTIETFDVSGNKAPFAGTGVASASDTGVVVGYYTDHRGEHHSFIRTP